MGTPTATAFPTRSLAQNTGDSNFKAGPDIVFGTPEPGAAIQELNLSAEGPTHVKITGPQSGDTAGYGQGIGDLNGDGLSDVMILGSYQDSGTSKAHLVLGDRDPPRGIDLITLGDWGFEIAAPLGVEIQGASASWSNPFVVGADFDGDRHQDLAIPYRSAVGEGIFIIFGPLVSENSSSFVRGDANADGRIEITNAIVILTHLFLGGTQPRCLDALDVNDTGSLDITDAIYLLGHLFLGTKAPPPPYPGEGEDPTGDTVPCGG